MKRITPFLPALCFAIFIDLQATAQKLPARWDEITAADWNNALTKSNKTCILPIGILEKHGPHVPMGSDLIRVREYALRATQKEYAVVFPDYFYGQINEAKHQPGVFALPERVVWDLLENTCDEIARNGFNKIIIINGHGGNPELIKYFIQTRLEKERNYAVFFFQPSSDSAFTRQVTALRHSDAAGDQHAGEKETSEVLYFRPDLVQLDSAKNESGKNLERLSIPNVYTGIWWYADYPNHYAGEGDKATTALGKLVADHTISQLIDAIKAIKSDNKTLLLQKEFYDRVIEILLKNKEIIKVNGPDEIVNQNLDFLVMQFIDHSEQELKWVEEKFGVDFSIMKHYEDIEISSHFLSNDHQVAFHISIPYYNEEKRLIESPIFFIISSSGLFFFSNAAVDHFFNKTYSYKFSQLQNLSDLKSILKFQIAFISDYYADITESETKKVKALASAILLEKEFSKEVMDLITRYNFNNLLLKESLIETTRVFNLYKKSSWEQKIEIKETIESEINDLSVVSDYIQFNFDRLDDLKENVSNKIDLEQNYIFKMLTVVTVCISLPTLIAGVYGMNFVNMPELQASFGYPIVIIAMIFSAVLPYIYFRRKKWL